MNKYSMPQSHQPYTDKYFLRTNEILKKEGLNPKVGMYVFAREQGPVAGLEEAVEIIKAYSDLEKRQGEVWVTRVDRFADQSPLMIIRGPARSVVELETLYLGVLSHAISRAMGLHLPGPEEILSKMQGLKEIYEEIPIIYFGARHYHWSMDAVMAEAALKGGAVQTSTDAGSAFIGNSGVGTIPHFLPIVLASIYGKEQATLKAAELFDRHMPPDIPRITVADTFNRELTDGLAVARYFGKRPNALRLDTCGENIGEGGSLYQGTKGPDPAFQTGTGVTIELTVHLRQLLIQNGFGHTTHLFLSSGFGHEDKARAFMNAHKRFKQETGFDLFYGVGIGELSKAKFCTADIYEVEGRPLSKTGREIESVDWTDLQRVL